MAIGLWLSIYQIVRSGQHISRRDFLAGHPETHCARRRHHDQIRLGLSHNLRNKERHHPQLAMTVVATVALSHEIPFPSCSDRLCTSGRLQPFGTAPEREPIFARSGGDGQGTKHESDVLIFC